MIHRKIVSTSPDQRAVADALYALAYTQFEGLHQPDSAIATLNQLHQRFSNMPVANQGLIILADCLLAKKQPAAADSMYHSIEMKRLPVNAQEELQFKKAELQFLLGDYTAAREGYSSLMNSFPKSIYVNDALRRIMLITEHEGMDQAMLSIFSEALLARRQFNPDSALQKLAELIEKGTPILADLAHLESGGLKQEQGDFDAALAEYDALVAADSVSFYAPIALELQGDIYSNQIKDCVRAKEVYEKVLLDHPNSLNADAVRRKLNRVERFLCAGAEDTKS
jgi:predicted negative regulator of RcsB-dependent stress response